MPLACRGDVRLLVGSVVAAGALLVAIVVGTAPAHLGEPFMLVALSLMLAATQVFPFVVVRDGEGDELWVYEAVLVIMFVLLPEAGVVVGALVSASLCHAFRPRSPLKTLYNHATHAVAVCVGLLAQRVVLGSGRGGDAWALVGAGVGVAVSSLITAVLVWAVLATVTGRSLREVAAPGVRFDAVVCTGAVGWGLVVVAASPSPVVLVLLCMAPAVLLRQLQHLVRQRHHLQILLDGAAETAAAVPSGNVESAVLRAARAALGGTEAVIRTGPPTGGEIGAPLRSTSGRRWLIATGVHDRDPFRDGGRAVLDGLASMASVALENVSLLERVGRDPVTDLPAGPLLLARLDHALGGGARSLSAACLAVKVTRLDVVKQTFGPGSANLVLAEIGARLSGLTGSDGLARPRAAVGYLGDGEFAIVAPGIGDRAAALEMAAEVEQLMRRPVAVAGIDLALNVSIGIALSGGPSGTGGPAAEVLVRDAIATAARIARLGGDRTALAEPSEAVGRADRLALEADLRAALDRDEIVVHYQPVVQVATGRIVGAEALARWDHPTRGVVSPSDFVALAEETALIVDLDRYVLASACRQLASWDIAGTVGGAFTLSVNLSARQLAEDDLVHVVGDVLASTGIDPHRLCLELTESGVMHDAATAAEVLHDLRSLGLQLAIDDFGTGYSSLAYLRDFPVDALKIDRSFIARMADTAGDAAIVAGTVRLAHALGLRVVAEGVEHEEQLAQLRMLGCDAAQGYFWGAAVPGAQFAACVPARADGAEPSATGVTHDEKGDHVVVAADHDEVLTHLAHEMRSPLTAILGFADLLAEGAHLDRDDCMAFARTIAANGRDLAGLLDTLEDARDVRLGTMSLDVEPVGVPALVESVVEAMRPQLAPRPVHVTTTGPAEVLADEARLRQVVRNLISNAAKFSAPSTPIEISVVCEDGQVRVSVRDHGPGVPAARRHELFRRFSRLGSQTKGLGIGLHLARTIARAHGGDISYEPASPGSCFTVGLPVAAAPPVAGVAPAGAAPGPSTALR